MIRQMGMAVTGVMLMTFASVLPAQDLLWRINAVRDGLVRFTYAARADVCGDGEMMLGWRNTEFQFSGSGVWNNRGDWRERCVHGPLRVTVTRREGQTVALRVVAGPLLAEAKDATDLGIVPAATAVRALMHIARTEESKAADRAILAAVLADSAVAWPDLLTIARNDARPRKVRQEARQWLSWLAADHVLGIPADGLGKKDRSSEKTQAVFVLSELPRGEGIPDLLRIGRSHSDPEVQRSALFWLGQSSDPRALDLFEELLRK